MAKSPIFSYPLAPHQPTILHCFDPGGTTGYCKLLSFPEKLVLLASEEFPSHIRLKEILHHRDGFNSIVVAESFQHIHQDSKTISVEVLGYIKALCDTRFFHLHTQPPGERLFAKHRWEGIHKFPKLGKHSGDAFLHGLTANVKLFNRYDFVFTDKR